MIDQRKSNFSPDVPAAPAQLRRAMMRVALAVGVSLVSLAPLAGSADASGGPAASAASRSHACPNISSSAHAIVVGGLSCTSADAVIRTALSSGARSHGFACHSKPSGRTVSVSCRKGRLTILYTTTAHAPRPAPVPTPTPAQNPGQNPAPTSAPAASVRIDAALEAPAAQPTIEGGDVLGFELTISDQTPWADSLLLYVTVPQQPCASSYEAYEGVTHYALPSVSSQEELHEGVEALVYRARNMGTPLDPAPLDATISILGNSQSTAQLSKVCAVLYNSSTPGGFATLATAQGTVTPAT
jgi:hypothetical protein